MSTQITLKNFEEIYEKTYNKILKYTILHCNNLDDVNDIIQDTYVELYKNIKRHKVLEIDEETGFIIGICKNILKKYYRRRYKSNVISIELQEIKIDDNLEMDFITRENVLEIWEDIKNKNIIIAKIFYLHYGLGIKIKEIAEEMDLTESAIKNYIYRTIKQLKEKYGRESDGNERK